jgi:hypothetical protein
MAVEIDGTSKSLLGKSILNKNKYSSVLLMNLKAKKFFILRKTCHFFFLLLLPYTEP